MPLEPDVLGQPCRPWSRSTSRTVSVTCLTASHATPGPGSRSTRSSSGCARSRSEEHTSELQSLAYLVCRLLLEKKKKKSKRKQIIIIKKKNTKYITYNYYNLI